MLLGVGGAWTGLDLKDHDAENPLHDTLLTDLVVARLPYNSNITPPAINRRNFMADADIMETALLLKQGFGRLIRREGVKDRNIWFLDGRPMKAFNRVIMLLLDSYGKQRHILTADGAEAEDEPKEVMQFGHAYGQNGRFRSASIAEIRRAGREEGNNLFRAFAE